MNDRIQEASNILTDFQMPRGQINDRTALCLLALLNMTPDKKWSEIERPLVGITPMMEFASINYNKKYAPNSRETFRRFSMHQLVDAGISLYNPDRPDRPVNSPKAVYQISAEAFEVIKKYGTSSYQVQLDSFLNQQQSLTSKYAAVRDMVMIPVKIKDGLEIKLSPGDHSELIKTIIEEFSPRFLPDSTLVYVGDTGEKWGYFDLDIADVLSIDVDQHGKMPDVVIYNQSKNWLILIESVTSHGPVDHKRHGELSKLFNHVNVDLIYVTAFPNKSIMGKYLSDIAWETEVWLADNPSHMIHFNGDKFLGPFV